MQHKTLGLSVAALALACSVTVRAQSPDAPIGELFPSEADARGVAVQAGSGMIVSNGSQLNAGKSPALLRLARGGQVRLCSQSGLGVNTVPGTQGLLLSMNTGEVVVNYALREYADTLVTPDFRILLAGPGTFHFALGVTGKGDTCIKPMPGNTSRLIVSETFGTGTYQLKEDEASRLPNVFLLQERVKRGVLVESAPEVSVTAPQAAPAQQEKKDKKEKKEKKGFFGRMKGMLSGMFH